ncbi:unnamed protein product [Adineta ricciae]|uniref:F-box domain-containing protein n=1 Tax=Adineta ricciae TaxID=249248 RepID=A0A816B078_ADIRI|nr:unnamed protein product [Adineta ricciae]
MSFAQYGTAESKMKTTLEDLCNEILLQILECVHNPYDIYRAFSRLNHRFDLILQSVRLQLDIFVEDKQSLTMIRYFSANCTHLRIYNMCPSISLQQFLRLRSLTIHEPTDAQMNLIQSTTLPMLEHLASPASMMIFDCLFSNRHKPWLYLHSCHFYFPHFPNSKVTWQPNRTLRTLSGVTCSRKTLSQLLSLLPSLKCLRVDMIANDLSDWNTMIFEKTLTSLRIGFHQLNYDDIRVLIGPLLRRLHIEVFCEQPSINFSLLGAVIMSRGKELEQFCCDYRGRNIPVDSIKTAHRMFQSIQVLPTHSYDTNSFKCCHFL